MVLAMVVALTAACGFALGNAIQHRAAGAVPLDGGAAKMLLRLARSPQWLLGSSLALTAFVLHATAMNLGVVAVVQPILLCGVLLAVPIRAFLGRQVPTRAELWWVGLTVVGIIVFVTAANTKRSSGEPHDGRALFLVLVGFTLAVLWASTAGRYSRRSMRAFVYATASGVVFGITAGLMKFVGHDAEHGWLGFVESWHIWVLLVGSILGTTLNQRSYQAANLSASLPAMNTTDIVIAVTFGWVVFNEPPSLTPVSFTIQILCLLCTGLGLLQVARAEDSLDVERHVHDSVDDDTGALDQVRPSVS